MFNGRSFSTASPSPDLPPIPLERPTSCRCGGASGKSGFGDAVEWQLVKNRWVLQKIRKGDVFSQRPHATAPMFGDLPLASLERRHRQLSHGVSGKSPNTGAVRWRGFENGTKMNEIPKYSIKGVANKIAALGKLEQKIENLAV